MVASACSCALVGPTNRDIAHVATTRSATPSRPCATRFDHVLNDIWNIPPDFPLKDEHTVSKQS